jgi:hypothetical protein
MFHLSMTRITTKICALLGYYTAYSSNFLSAFRDLSVPSSRIYFPWKMVLTGCPETSEGNYHCTQRNKPEEHGPHLLREGRLKFMQEYLNLLNSFIKMLTIAKYLHENQYRFMVISRSILLRRRDISDKSCTKNKNTHFVFSKFVLI